MAISLVGTATGTTTATPPAHQAGDLFLVFAYRDGNTTAPTLASGFTSVNTSSGNTNSFRVGRKFAASSSETVGTWTNATSLILIVLRGVNTSTPTGGTNTATGSSTTITYSSLTLANAAGSSWAIAFAGHRSTDVAINTVPSGMTLATSVSDATDEAAGFYQAGVTTFASKTATVGGTASGWISSSIEVRAQPDPVLTNVGVSITAAASIIERSQVTARASAVCSTTVTRALSAGKSIVAQAAASIARAAIVGKAAQIAALTGVLVWKGLARTVEAAALSSVSAVASRAYLVTLGLVSTAGAISRRSVAKTRSVTNAGAVLTRRLAVAVLPVVSQSALKVLRLVAKFASMSIATGVALQRAVGARRLVSADAALATAKSASVAQMGGFSSVVAASRSASVWSGAASAGAVTVLSALTEAVGYLRGRVSTGSASASSQADGPAVANISDEGVISPKPAGSNAIRRVFAGIIKRKR